MKTLAEVYQTQINKLIELGAEIIDNEQLFQMYFNRRFTYIVIANRIMIDELETIPGYHFRMLRQDSSYTVSFEVPNELKLTKEYQHAILSSNKANEYLIRVKDNIVTCRANYELNN